MTNFQDVLRDVHDPSLHVLKTTASLSASTVYVGNPTLYAVVNTAAAGDSVNNIGFATVAVSTPTLYAVVNTSAVGVGNSIVTVANPNFGINAGVNGIGFATVNVVNGVSLIGNLTVNTQPIPLSYYSQSSLISGYAYYGFSNPGSNPTTASFRIQRETLNTGEILFANGAATFVNVWSAASLSSIIYG